MKERLRYEGGRTGLTPYKADEACGVKNTASRKYLTRDHLGYYPSFEAFEKMVKDANLYGNPNGRAKFYCEIGMTDVWREPWREPPVRGPERLKD